MTKEFDKRNAAKSRKVCEAMAEAASTGKRVLTERERRILDRLADFIDPDELTCHMVFDHLTDTAFCDVCGERFDGVAQYMAMVPNGFSLADYKAKYKDANFCPNCGAKVVRG